MCLFVVKLKIKTQQRNRVRNNLLSDLSPDDLTVTSAVHLSCFSPLSSRFLYDLDGHLMRTELTINHTPPALVAVCKWGNYVPHEKKKNSD